MIKIIFSAFSVLFLAGAAFCQKCPFTSNDTAALSRCLIRPVLHNGIVGKIPAELPPTLKELIGQPMDIDLTRLRQYLSENAIPLDEVGGPVEQDMSKVRFFVIHDTSFPTVNAATFPSNMNEEGANGSSLANWISSSTPTHVFVNRLGESRMKANFSTTVGATKYEGGLDKPKGSTARVNARAARRGLFVHIELVQSRRRSRPNSSYYDIAPTPGFTQAQTERLALLYVVASVRSNKWLLPAFHLAVDNEIAEAHDDPQNFDLNTWLNSVDALLKKLRPSR